MLPKKRGSWRMYRKIEKKRWKYRELERKRQRQRERERHSEKKGEGLYGGKERINSKGRQINNEKRRRIKR